MLKRIISGVVLAPLVLSLFWWGPDWGIESLLAVVVALAVWEFTDITQRISGSSQQRAWSRGLAVAVSLGAFWGWVRCPVEHHLLIFLTGFFVVAFAHTFLGKDHRESAHEVGWSMFAALYIAGTLACVGMIVHGSQPKGTERALCMAILWTVWLGDTGAYFVGKAIGKHKLAPRLSPKKTIEGSIGGLLGAVLGIVFARTAFDLPGTWTWMLVFALASGVLEQAGDLFESMLKRAANVKDSGKLIPGHGGILDRLDGIFFAAPLFVVYPLTYL
jgi:phosphatidate cytidylyltransferase